MPNSPSFSLWMKIANENEVKWNWKWKWRFRIFLFPQQLLLINQCAVKRKIDCNKRNTFKVNNKSVTKKAAQVQPFNNKWQRSDKNIGRPVSLILPLNSMITFFVKEMYFTIILAKYIKISPNICFYTCVSHRLYILISRKQSNVDLKTMNAVLHHL